MIEFRFNRDRAVFGVLEERTSEAGPKAELVSKYFIAAPLLPVATVAKFTGGNMMGVPDDDMTRAIHAFTHFVWKSSREYLMLCDLQGEHTETCLACHHST